MSLAITPWLQSTIPIGIQRGCFAENACARMRYRIVCPFSQARRWHGSVSLKRSNKLLQRINWTDRTAPIAGQKNRTQKDMKPIFLRSIFLPYPGFSFVMWHDAHSPRAFCLAAGRYRTQREAVTALHAGTKTTCRLRDELERSMP